MVTEQHNAPQDEAVMHCRVCAKATAISPCSTCAKALELLRGFSGIEHWEHVAEIASRVVQLPSN